MMNFEEGLEFIESSVWGEGSDDTRVIARLLLEINESLRISNSLKLEELRARGLSLSDERLQELGLTSD